LRTGENDERILTDFGLLGCRWYAVTSNGKMSGVLVIGINRATNLSTTYVPELFLYPAPKTRFEADLVVASVIKTRLSENSLSKFAGWSKFIFSRSASAQWWLLVWRWHAR